MTFEEWWKETYSFDGLPAPDGERKEMCRRAWQAALDSHEVQKLRRDLGLI